MTGLLTSCSEQKSVNASFYKSEIKVTSFGIPHITADDFGSLGFGEGYMAARDHVCNIAYGLVEARGERAKYFGAGEKNKHVKSDVLIKALDISDNAEQYFKGQTDENQQWISGYTSGYNKYINDIGRDNITSWCKGADWVHEVKPQDIFARFLLLAQTTRYMSGMIVSAAPPQSEAEKSGDKTAKLDLTSEEFAESTKDLGGRHMGSNAWAFGKNRTENGRGMLLGNPHYPWTGTDRFWEKHLIIPGRLNIYGTHLLGAPGVAIGFNENVGWSHTVSDSERVVFYTLDLVPGDPTSYFYDGKPRKMIAKKISLPVKDENGTETIENHVVWFSHYGPMVNLPNAPWTTTRAITIRDANVDNHNLLDQWKDMDLAKDMDSFKQAHKKWNAMPWVNSMATSKDGRAVYIDGTNVARLSPEAIALWRDRTQTDPLTKEFNEKLEHIILDGSDSRFEWQPHPEARVAGVVPFVEQPQYDRSDYIFNANDSYWLTNAKEPLEGYSPLFGPERTARTLRTRMNAKFLSDTSPKGPAGEDGKFSLQEMQAAILSNRSLTAELLLDELVSACTAQPAIKYGSKTVDLSKACIILKGYNKHLDLDANGAVLFREWITLYPYEESFKKGELFAIAFDPNDPINTPRDLADKTLALVKLAEAIENMQSADLSLDSTLGDIQFSYKSQEKIAIHGGLNEEGIANIIDQWRYDAMAPQVNGNRIASSKYLTDVGYSVTAGTSFLLSLSYTDEGPKAEAFLTYGESGDPTSEHYTDQTKLFAKKQWRPILFNMTDINQDIKESFILTGPR
ncbi:MAG: acylase [Emcibacter sp.]|nr:acylase [Emcibacter sp.]